MAPAFGVFRERNESARPAIDDDIIGGIGWCSANVAAVLVLFTGKLMSDVLYPARAFCAFFFAAAGVLVQQLWAVAQALLDHGRNGNSQVR